MNAEGVFLCLKYKIAQMLKNGGGAIVNLTVAGLVGVRGLGPCVASVALTKRANLPSSAGNESTLAKRYDHQGRRMVRLKQD